MEKVIFFGNGPLANCALAVIERECQVVFHVRTHEDLEEVKRVKTENPEAYGILASFGIMIRGDILNLFEPEGILNIHPSLLPMYRGASPIESAIIDGADDFAVSVMKLVKAMDAGPIYYQEILKNLPLNKDAIYQALAEVGTKWVCKNLTNLPKPILQDNKKATFCSKLDKSMSLLTPKIDTAEQTFRKIVAYQGFPKPKYVFCGVSCIILEAHISKLGEVAPLAIPCADGLYIAVDRLQPEGRKPMNAKAFLNGYSK